MFPAKTLSMALQELFLTSLVEVFLGDGNTGTYAVFELAGPPGFWVRF